MYCIVCGTLNSKDSLFCKKCGYSLVESYLNKNNNNLVYDNGKSNKIKYITKNYNKKKVINKKIIKKDKDKKNNDNNIKYIEKTMVVRKMTLFQKIMFFLLILIVLLLMGVICFLGLYIFSKNTVEVPYVVGMNYKEAKEKLEGMSLAVSRKDVEGDIDIVLKQSKKDGTHVKKGSNIKLEVGVENKYLPNLLNMSKSAAISILNKYSIKYEIEYIDFNDEVVLYQSYKEGTNINNIKMIKLKIGKKDNDDDKKVNNKNDVEIENNSANNNDI